MAFAKRITIVGAEGGHQRVYKKKKKKRKVSKWLKPAEKRQRRMLRGNKAYTDELFRRHKRSNRKRRNGFMRDGSLNQMRAMRKGMKKMKLGRM